MASIPVKYYNTFVLRKFAQGDVNAAFNWYIEESRIKGGYNNVQTGLAPRAFLRAESNRQETLSNSIIYSGILNSRTGINQTNQFPSGEDITRTVDPSKGSIQKLYAEDTNLIIFQENKVNRALIDKDAVYTQEGVPMQTTSNVVIGAIQPYAGEFGISKNPESFAVYGYRKYFTDASQGAVLRLSRDGITEISANGMYDFFRDQFATLGTGRSVGGWDIHNKCYTLSIQPSIGSNFETLSFDEIAKGWVSRYSYKPDLFSNVQNNFYSTKDGGIYLHYVSSVNRANFYGNGSSSTVTTVFNANPSLVKNFQTINYEGAGNWELTSISTDSNDSANSVQPFTQPTSLVELDNQLFKNEFKRKENKYFANLVNTSSFNQGEVTPLFLGGNTTNWSVSGIKGFTAQALLTATNNAGSGNNELFAVSTNYKESSY